MPDDNNNPIPDPMVPASTDAPEPSSGIDATNPVVVSPTLPDAPSAPKEEPSQSNVMADVAHKIADSQNVLIALSSDPSVDEISAALGLSLFLDKLGKNATAIYSGATPNALEFLKPEETFESSADALQDFVVALSKEKADHLRYKLDGDYVKIYITPYRTSLSEDDLEFSHGDYNIDLVLALDVTNGIDLDSALREHGRIMHDATIINITTGNPGKFGEIEWSDKSASSVSEMIAELLYGMNTKEKLGPEEATAFLTGIVAATDRFSSASTTSKTMKLSSKLMESGANQQLISQNITPDVENEMFNMLPVGRSSETTDATELDIEHLPSENVSASEQNGEASTEQHKDTSAESDPSAKEPTSTDTSSSSEESALLDDLQAAAASLAQAGDETVPTPGEEPLKIDSSNMDLSNMGTPDTNTPAINLGQNSFPDELKSNDYGQMLNEALANTDASTPDSLSSPIISSSEDFSGNPAATNAPVVPTNPEINGVPEINYMPMPGEEILPPPPAPPINMDANSLQPTSEANSIDPSLVQPIAPATPTQAPTPEPLGSQPAMQDQIYGPQASDPGAFKIPGM